MNISFHYYVTRVLAEKAGFAPADAQTIAFACQQVDDANRHTPMKVKNLPPPEYERMSDGVFDPTCTAHKGITNILYGFTGIRRKILMPFHFIPEAWDSTRRHYKYLTIPGAPLAHTMVKIALEKLSSSAGNQLFRQLALIKLGIALHGYEDSFAHQGFSGRNNKLDNDATDILDAERVRLNETQLIGQLVGFIGYHIGHGLLGDLPDKIGIVAYYLNGRGLAVMLDNVARFTLAAEKTFALLRDFTGSATDWPSISTQMVKMLSGELPNLAAKSGKTDWQKTFSKHFPEIFFDYKAQAWEKEALRQNSGGSFTYKGESGQKWIHFHRAAFEQRQFMLANLK